MFFDNYLNESYITEAFKSIEEIKDAQKKINDLDQDFLPYAKSVLRTIAYIGGAGAAGGGSAALMMSNPALGAVGLVASIVGMYLVPLFTKWIRMPGSPDDKIVKCDRFIRECEQTLKKVDDPKMEKEVNRAIKQAKDERMKIIKSLPKEVQDMPKYKKYFI